MTPSGIASSTAISVDMIASWSESAKRSRISSRMGAPVHMDLPKSSRTMPVSQARNCVQSGWSRPSRTRSLSRFSFEANALSPANRSSTMSPGTTRIRKKMSTATPSSVGIIRRSRLTMYLPMRSVPPLAERLLGEPHGVELLVQEVAGRDRPATNPRAVRDDPVPLERVEIVRFLVEKPLLELAHEPLALLRVDRPTLPGVQLVEHAVADRNRDPVRPAGPPEKAWALPPPFVDVAPVPAQPLQLGRWRGERRAGNLHAGHGLHDGDPRQRLGALVAVERQGQRPADPPVVERFPLVVHRDQQVAVPGALLHRDLGAHGRSEEHTSELQSPCNLVCRL